MRLADWFAVDGDFAWTKKAIAAQKKLNYT
jgi:hypothetical protein